MLQPKGISKPVHIRLRTTDLSVCNEMLIRNEYACNLPCFPRTIVDVGANIGMASVYQAHNCNRGRDFQFRSCSEERATYPNIIPLHAALWNREGEINVSEPDSATGAIGEWAFITHEGEGVPVRAITMTTPMAQMKIDTIDLLKIDIEGAEKEVFEDCDWM